jgi:hypothetical protein
MTKQVSYSDLTPGRQQAEVDRLSQKQSQPQQVKDLKRLIRLSREEESE